MLSRKNSFQVALGLILGTVLWYGCGSSDNNNGPSGPAVAPAVPTPTATVLIQAGASTLGTGAYSPDPLNIAPGTNVVWVNKDVTPHSATSDTAGTWDTGPIQPSATSSPIPFPSAGTFDYGSSVAGDGGLSGQVIVASPTPSPSPSPSASPGSWDSVALQQNCPYPQCPAGDGFTVSSDGSYLTGRGNSGHVTRADLAVLNAAATPIAQNSSQLAYSCVDQAALPGAASATVDETFSLTGNTQRIYDYETNSGDLCFRGSKANAQALYDAILALARVYDNGATPSPSPSASPSESPSASPTPSPSESMTMLPR